MNWKQSWIGVAMAVAIGAPPVVAQPAPSQRPATTRPAAARPAAGPMSEAVAAIVNDDVISTFDVRQRANLILLSAGVQPSAEILPRASAQALRELVDDHLKMQEAKKFDVAVSAHDVDQRVAQIAQANELTAEAFLRNLAGAGVSASTLRKQIEADLAWQRLMSGMFRTRVRISPVEVRETQARIAASATQPQFLISEIFLPAETDAEFTEVQTGAQRLLEQMQRGAPFPMIARQFSAAPSAAAGGDMGWLAATELPAELQTVVQRLQPGQVSVPVRGESGVYIVALRDRREGIAAGSATMVGLRQITAPEASRSQLERLQHRISTCEGLDRQISNVPEARLVDLGEPAESDLSEAMRSSIAHVSAGSAAPVTVADGQASTIVVCSRTVGGAGVPSTDDIENRLFEQELARQSERYLRNLRREAAIITR